MRVSDVILRVWREPPKWARIKFAFLPRFRVPFVTMAIAGLIIRLNEIIPSEISGSVFIRNATVYFLSFGYWDVTSIEVLYVSSLFYVAAFAIYSAALPREVQVCNSKADYVSRLSANITELNYYEWFMSIKSDTVFWNSIDVDLSRRIENFASHFHELYKSGRPSTLEGGAVVALKDCAMRRYNFANSSNKFFCRHIIFVFLAISNILLILCTVNSIFLTVSSMEKNKPTHEIVFDELVISTSSFVSQLSNANYSEAVNLDKLREYVVLRIDELVE